MARKNIEGIYNNLFKLQTNLNEIADIATDIATDIKSYGGELSRVVNEQFGKYFIPTIKSLNSDNNTPGSISGIITFLDSVPLALTRQDPSTNDMVDTPQANLTIPTGTNSEETAVENSVEDLPTNASYAQGTTVQESRMKEYSIFNVVRVSSAGGDIKPPGRQVICDYDNEEEAQKKAKYLNEIVTPMEKELWDIKYVVEEVKKEFANGWETSSDPKEVKPEKVDKVEVIN